MMPPIKQEKDALREKYKVLRREISPDEKLRRDKAICERSRNLASYRYAKHVLLYAATPDEISLFALAESALKAGKKVFFPRCNTEERTMTYHSVSSLDELSPDSYGICEPPESAPVFDPQKDQGFSVCFVPGLLFDRMGFRLGYGGGYYDRFLSSFGGNRVGIVYSDFILPQVPRGRFDEKMDILLTERNNIIIKAANEN